MMIGSFDKIISIITIGIAMLALIQTNKQIKLSNKQSLFTLRLNNYSIIKGVIELYKENKNLLNNREEAFLANDFVFKFMVNNSYLEHIADVISNPLEYSIKKEFLKQMEELKRIALENKLLYSKGKYYLLSEFVICYRNVLLQMHKYQIVIKKIEDISNKFNIEFEKAANQINEIKYREELYTSFKLLEETYENIVKNKVLIQIENQIKLR